MNDKISIEMEQPLQLTIFGQNLNLIVIAIILFGLVFSFSYWYQSRFKMKPIAIFDVIVVGLVFSILISRILSVLIHLEYYALDVWQVFNIFDKGFIYIGVFFGLIVSTNIVYSNSKREKDYYQYLEKIIISYALAIIPLLLLVTLGGKMLGIELQDGERMPVNLFRIGYNFLFIIIWLIVKKNNNYRGVIIPIYLMLFGLVEFILRMFSSGYSAYLFDVIDVQQFVAVIIFIIGLITLVTVNKPNNANNYKDRDAFTAQKRSRRQEFSYSSAGMLQSPRERFSLSYSKMQTSRDVKAKERFKIMQENVKRRLKKKNEKDI